MQKLKRESFLNSLLIILNSDNSLSNNSQKSLLDLYLTTDLSNIEKLSILEIYSFNNDLFNNSLSSLGLDTSGAVCAELLVEYIEVTLSNLVFISIALARRLL